MPVKRVGKGISQAKLENGQKRGLILSAKLVAQRATGKAPIDTGRLKRSITHSRVHRIGRDQFGIDIGTNVEYAPYQEFGTRFMQAQPYLMPALRESKKAIISIMANSIKASLK